jgi:hypothetical protein
VRRAWREIGQKGHIDLAASELAIRAATHRIRGRLLEKLLNTDGGGYQGSRLACAQGHAAPFLEYREKALLTVLGPLQVRRAYYHCDRCGEGVIPKGGELDIAGTSFSPGVRRMMGQAGGKEPLDDGREDLQLLAGLPVTTKAVERVAEAVGEQIEQQNQREQKQILSGRVVPFWGKATLPKMYVAIDGSGVPVVARETAGRPGKGETAQAKTREARLGCIFTQTRVDEEGYAVRDEESTTYVGAIQIVDLYHAREHLAKVAKLLYELKDPKSQAWLSARREELDEGKVEAVIAALSRPRRRDNGVQKELQTEIEYFRGNAPRMRYAEFRRQGLIVGSGVAEAGCKTIFGQRLKLSGMHWTVRGANAIIAMRCCQLSGHWEEFWDSRATG